MAIRKTKRIRPFVAYFHTKPNSVCPTEDWWLWVGGFRRVIELGRLKMRREAGK